MSKVSNIPNVVGEGTYGCVHDPSLECNESGINYNNKVSKILLDKYAKIELDEYLGIQRADPENQFFLGVPIKCKPKQTESNYHAVKKCSKGSLAVNEKKNKILSNFDLLIMENGGMNLYDFAKSMEKKPATKENQKIMEKFWIECHRLFLGLKVFLKENIMHHDLKSQNIVYNPTNNRVAFIDFGLMRPLDSQKGQILRGEGIERLIHWSYPVETMIYSRDFYNSKRVKDTIMDKLNEGIDSVYDGAFLNNVLPRTNVGDDIITRDTMTALIYYSMVDFIKGTETITYEEFLDKSLDTFDLYGMCMGLMYVFIKTFHILKETNSKIDYIELYRHLWYSFRPDNTRYTVEQSLNLYEERILSDILREDHIIFIDHIPTKIEPPPHLRVPKMSDALLEKSMEEKDEKLRKKVCPTSKVLNPLTGRCVKECKPGKQRDEKFTCKTVKNSKGKTSRILKGEKSEKTCSENKERNPKTRRCIKKCKDRYVRNKDFKCVNEKYVDKVVTKNIDTIKYKNS